MTMHAMTFTLLGVSGQRANHSGRRVVRRMSGSPPACAEVGEEPPRGCEDDRNVTVSARRRAHSTRDRSRDCTDRAGETLRGIWCTDPLFGGTDIDTAGSPVVKMVLVGRKVG